MLDAFDENSTDEADVNLSLDLIEEEITSGLPMQAERLCACFVAEEYYRGANEFYVPPRPSEEWEDYLARPKRCSKITRKVIRTLTQDLYSPGPERKLAQPRVHDWLATVYEANHINALFQQADRKATLNALAAIQVTATGRAEKPMQLSLWGAHEFVWWPYPDDPTEPWAIATLAREKRLGTRGMEHRLRIEAWSRDEHRFYLTRWVSCPELSEWRTNGYRSLFGVEAQFAQNLSGYPTGSNTINPYGVLPFALVHDEMPIVRIDEGGIGDILVRTNAEIDRQLSEVAEHMTKYLNPHGFVRGVPANFRIEKRPGGFQVLPPSKATAEGDFKTEPTAFFVQAGLAIEHAWTDITNYVNQTLEELDVPLEAYRANVATDASGVAIIARQLPLIRRTNARRVVFNKAEKDLAAVILTAGGNFYRQPELLAAADEPDLNLIWPDAAFPIISKERDEASIFELDNHLKSLLMVVCEREGMTRDQAIAHIKQVAADNDFIKSILPPPEPEAVGMRAGDVGDPNPVVQDSSGTHLLDSQGQAGQPVPDQTAAKVDAGQGKGPGSKAAAPAPAKK
jgi:hypothetical protein